MRSENLDEIKSETEYNVEMKSESEKSQLLTLKYRTVVEVLQTMLNEKSENHDENENLYKNKSESKTQKK